MAEQSQWNDLIEHWQACEVVKLDEQKSAIDIKQLQESTRKRAGKMKFFMWLDIVTTIVSVLMFGYLLTTDINLQQSVIFVVVMFVIIPVGFYSVWVRRGLWEANGNDTKAYLELARARTIAGVKLAQANIYAIYAAFPLILGVIIWRGIIRFDDVDWPFNLYVFGFIFELVITIAMICSARYYQRKKQKELMRLDEMMKELD